MQKNYSVGDFHHSVSGREGGPWVIFLHGLLGFGANWRRVTPFFESEFRVLVFDQRGHGRSVKPSQGYAPEDFAGDVLIFMEHYKIKKTHLVGHSMGGRNALSFSTSYPEKVDRLVIEDIGPEAQPLDASRIEKLLASVPVPFKTKLEAKEFLLNKFEDPKLGQYLYANLVDGPNGGIIWQFEVEKMIETIRLGRSDDRWNEWYALQCPTLVIRGSESKDLSAEVFSQMLRQSRVAKGITINGAGHWVHSEKPEDFAREALGFLKMEK